MKNEIYTDAAIRFQSFGVKIEIRAAEREFLGELYAKLERVFPNGLEAVAESEIAYRFSVRYSKDSKFELYRNGEKLCEDHRREFFLDQAESHLRITVAEFAFGKVFLHAGAVGWKGRAIVIPATSFSGKSTLVAELVKKGALYYSDEYAVLDADGAVEPFPKWLSLRGGKPEAWRQEDCPVESIGGTAGVATLPVGMVLLAKFKSGKKNPHRWQPRAFNAGRSVDGNHTAHAAD